MSPETTHKLIRFYMEVLTSWYTLVHCFCSYKAVSYRVHRVKPASVDSQGQHSSIYLFFCLRDCLFVVGVFDMGRVSTDYVSSEV